MATSEGIPSSIDIEFLELNDNPYTSIADMFTSNWTPYMLVYNYCYIPRFFFG